MLTLVKIYLQKSGISYIVIEFVFISLGIMGNRLGALQSIYVMRDLRLRNGNEHSKFIHLCNFQYSSGMLKFSLKTSLKFAN